jgi:hypothetical protein
MRAVVALLKNWNNQLRQDFVFGYEIALFMFSVSVCTRMASLAFTFISFVYLFNVLIYSLNNVALIITQLSLRDEFHLSNP